jgi:ATP-dependent Lhr-like helicase
MHSADRHWGWRVRHADFAGLLRSLGSHGLLIQDSSGLLLAGILGERLINQYDFYSAFTSGDEFRLLAEGRALGSIPISRPITPGQRLIFGGRRWRVLDVDPKSKVILVSADRGGTPPSFDGSAGSVGDRVRQDERDPQQYEDLDVPGYGSHRAS